MLHLVDSHSTKQQIMIPTLKESHLAVYVLCLLVLVVIAVTGTVLFDDQVQKAKDDDKWVLVLTVAQRTTPLAIGVLITNVIIIEFGYFISVDIPRSRAVGRRTVMIHNWLEQRRRERREKEEQLEQERRLREVIKKEAAIRELKNQMTGDRTHVE